MDKALNSPSTNLSTQQSPTVATVAELTNVSKSYPEPLRDEPMPVLENVNLKIEEGESLAIVGPSGCGKSTLLNILGTLDQPDSGEVTIRGEAIAGLNEKRLAEVRGKHIGFIFQLHHLLPQCSVIENVLIPTLALDGGGNTSELRERAEELLTEVGLKERLHHRPGQLSGGERQRVAVVRSLINNPGIVLADEPTGSLDQKSAGELTDLLLTLQSERGVSLVVVTHDPGQAAKMGRVLEFADGALSEK